MPLSGERHLEEEMEREGGGVGLYDVVFRLGKAPPPTTTAVDVSGSGRDAPALRLHPSAGGSSL